MEKTNSAMATPPPDWVMLDRTVRTVYFIDDISAPSLLRSKKEKSITAVQVRTSYGLSGLFSFKLAAPPDVSYLDLYWPKHPEESSSFPTDLVFSSVLAADKDLLLISIDIPTRFRDDKFPLPHDLFVYTAARPLPSLLRFPLYTKPPLKGFRKFFVRESEIGILRLSRKYKHYVVADLIVDQPSGSSEYVAELCVFFPFSRSRTIKRWGFYSFTDELQPSGGGQFPVCWETSTVLPFDGRFLCWIDYFSGVLLLDFSQTKDPMLRFLPFPGKQYPDEVRMGTGRCVPDRFRSVSISQGMMCFVDIDNDFHERMHMDSAQLGQTSGPKNITVWILNVGDLEWKKHHEIKMDDLWDSYESPAIPRCLPEFPVITMEDPDHVWCLLREKEFEGKAWKITVDMKHAKLDSCTPYVNDQPYVGEVKSTFANKSLLPAVFSKYFSNTTGILGDSNKFETLSSKRVRPSV